MQMLYKLAPISSDAHVLLSDAHLLLCDAHVLLSDAHVLLCDAQCTNVRANGRERRCNKEGGCTESPCAA